jgi:putative FmdB family regulatory protein
MPIYEYRCSHCGHELEVIQKVSDSPLVQCPECGELKLTKQLSAPSFRLKGGGWYETDFKKDGTKKNLHESGEAKKITDEKKTGEVKKEAKKETKKETKPASSSSSAA